MPTAELIGASVLAFVSTNLDDALVLLAFFGDRRFDRRQVVLGQFLGIAVLVAVSAAFAALAIKLPEGSTRWLGLLPILIGLRQLWAAWRFQYDPEFASPEKKGWLGVTTVTISNGGDNIAVYVPLIAKIGSGGAVVLIAVFAAMTALWCAGAILLLRHPKVSNFFSKWGHRITPFVLISLGAYVLMVS